MFCTRLSRRGGRFTQLRGKDEKEHPSASHCQKHRAPFKIRPSKISRPVAGNSLNPRLGSRSPQYSQPAARRDDIEPFWRIWLPDADFGKTINWAAKNAPKKPKVTQTFGETKARRAANDWSDDRRFRHDICGTAGPQRATETAR